MLSVSKGLLLFLSLLLHKNYMSYNLKMKISQCLNVNVAFLVICEKSFMFLSDKAFPEIYKAKTQNQFYYLLGFYRP